MTDYPQLDGRALTLLSAAAHKTSIADVARRLGYKRPTISMALRGKYVGDTRKIRARIFEVFADRIDCPFLGADITPDDCRMAREKSIPSGPRAAIDHWRACRHCVFNPDNLLKKKAEAAHV